MCQPVNGKSQDTGGIKMKESLLLIIGYDQLLLLPHMYCVAVQHGSIMLNKIIAFEQVDPDNKDKLDSQNRQHHIFHIFSRKDLFLIHCKLLTSLIV